jgi:hypothetical protein
MIVPSSANISDLQYMINRCWTRDYHTLAASDVNIVGATIVMPPTTSDLQMKSQSSEVLYNNCSEMFKMISVLI